MHAIGLLCYRDSTLGVVLGELRHDITAFAFANVAARWCATKIRIIVTAADAAILKASGDLTVASAVPAFDRIARHGGVLYYRFQRHFTALD